MKNRNRNARNFGLRNRCIIRAGTNALREAEASFVTQASNTSRWRQFCKFLKSEFAISDMRDVTRMHVEEYAMHLKLKLKRDEISISTAHDYLAAVNRVLEIARGDRCLRVAAVGDAGLNRRTNVAQSSKATPATTHAAACDRLPPHLATIIRLQRALGLRFEESLKINPSRALGEALRLGRVRIVSGTKGGRPREIEVNSPDQLAALKGAIQWQSARHSLIPEDVSYVQFKRWCYRQLEAFELTFHGERHAYANSRYRQLTGTRSPVESGKTKSSHIAEIMSSRSVNAIEAKQIDIDARLVIAEELGHSRIEISNTYLGK